MLRIIGEVTLKRVRLLVALGHLDHELAGLAVDEAFRDYADAVGAAQDKLLATHFIDENGEVRTSTKPNAELRAAALEYGTTLREATDRLVKDIAAAGATAPVPADRVEADLYRAIAASVYQSALEGAGDSSHPGYDVLRGYDEALAIDPVIRAAADRAAHDEGASKAFGAALATYRDGGRKIGRACVERMGEYCFESFTFSDPSRPPPADADKLRAQSRAARHEWRVLNEQCADAIEVFLRSGGDEVPAAAWRTRNYAVVAQTIVSSASWAQANVDSAAALGVSDEESKAMQAIVRDSLVERAARVKAVVVAFRRWEEEARKANQSVAQMDAPAELLTADDKRAATEKSIRDRVLACVRSSLSKSDLEAVQQPIDPGNFWRQMYEQRTQQASDQPKQEEHR
ncbi:MAG: hypothetical protein SGJ09_15655 [Phycisphaerae bacterium]|nr:hypothetical protein [Phycisphaerae bacterium]MDZ4831621.1 hypothetical protein [Phycisphaerae bacterium]